MSCRLFWVATVLILISISSVNAEQDSWAIYGDSLCLAKIIDERFVFSLKVYKNKLYGIAAVGNHKNIAIYSADGILSDSIVPGGVHGPDSAYIIGGIHNFAFDKKGNIWLMTKRAPIVIDKKGRSRIVAQYSQYESYGSIGIGKGNDVLLFTSMGIFKTSDAGNSWKHIKGIFPEITEPAKITVDGDTIWYDLIEAGANGIYFDKNGRYWAGSRFGLIYSDDDLESWYIGDSTAFSDNNFIRGQSMVIGITSKDELMVRAPAYRLWVKAQHKEPKLVFDLFSEYYKSKQTDNFRDFGHPVMLGNYIYYIDCYYAMGGGGCFTPKKWLKSCINLSNDLGITWKQYRFGKDVEISEVTVLGNSVFVSSNKGLLMIPLSCFH
ncbi:MAG TPA: hypothetical protein DEO84_10155 [candidate division Zixibacteria bacterium]|jgi:hypothetical protein|nr:hypothetical protein [candidate division Zixibacteria bacterium]HBZ01668.1 hypothetical protein [candidate division Zixibacteria bacterium]